MPKVNIELLKKKGVSMIAKINRFASQFLVLLLVMPMSLFASFGVPASVKAVAGPVIDTFTIYPDDGTSTNDMPTIMIHTTDSTADLTVCEYRYKSTVDPWTNWLTVPYYPDTDAQDNPIPGTGFCAADPDTSILTVSNIEVEMRVTDTAGLTTTTIPSISRQISTAIPVITVAPVITDNNPLPTITGTIDNPNTILWAEIHNLDYSIYSYLDLINNGDGTWDGTVLDALLVGEYILDVIATDYVNYGYASTTYTVISGAIDTTPPVITIDPYNINPTNQDVIVTASTNEGTLNTTSHTFTANGSFDFVATDLAGNVTTVTVTITNIDKVAPIITIDPYNTNPTNQDVIVTASTNEGTLNATSHTFTANGSFDFVATDLAGNVTTQTVTITNIDKVAPIITIDPYNTAPTSQDVIVTASTNEGSLNATSHTFTANGSFDFVATDLAGNVTTRTVTITNISKTGPVITINPYNTAWTNQDITVTASTNIGTLNATLHTFTANGSFDFVANDNGNITTVTVTITNIDKTAPTNPGVPQSLPNPTNLLSQNWSWTASTDTDSGIAGYYYRLAGASTVAWTFIGNLTSLTTNLAEGVYQFFIKAIDNAGNESFEVAGDLTIDTTPPAIDAHSDVFATATSISGAIVDYLAPPVTDNMDITVSTICDPAPGSLFPVGTTVVNCNATDASGNVALTTQFNVVVSFNAVSAPVLDNFSVQPSDGVSTNANPFLFVHATDSMLDITSCQYRFSTDIDPWTGWLDAQYWQDTDANDLPIFGAGTCISPAIDLSAGATTFNGELRVINSGGNFTDSGIVTLNINRVIPTISVNSVVTDNNPLPTITGSVDVLDATVWVEIHNADYSISYYYDGINNGDGTWSAAVTDTIPNGDYILDAFASNSINSGFSSGTYTVNGAVIDTTPPVITIDPYNMNPTNQDITVTASTNEGSLNATSHIFTANGSFDFVATDAAGNVTIKTVTITNIDKTAPVITINPYNAVLTNQDVIVTASANEGTLNASTHTFNQNGAFDFIATDLAGNVTTVTVTINNIDKVAPVINIDPYDTTPTHQDVVVTASVSGGLLNFGSHTFTGNGSFDFVASDPAGNVTIVTVTIDNIYPVISAETAESTAAHSVTITWVTNEPTTGRVVYDTVSHPSIAGCTQGSNYNYAFSTAEDLNKVLNHSVTITGLTPGTTYYFRSVSKGSPEAASTTENSFVTQNAQTVIPPEPVVIPVTTIDSNDTAPSQVAATNSNSNSSTTTATTDPVATDTVATDTTNTIDYSDVSSAEAASPDVLGAEDTSETSPNLWIWIVAIAIALALAGAGYYGYLRRRQSQY